MAVLCNRKRKDIFFKTGSGSHNEENEEMDN